jgi:phage-related protein
MVQDFDKRAIIAKTIEKIFKFRDSLNFEEFKQFGKDIYELVCIDSLIRFRYIWS